MRCIRRKTVDAAHGIFQARQHIVARFGQTLQFVSRIRNREPLREVADVDGTECSCHLIDGL